MNPIYENQWVKLYHGDCFQVMPKLEMVVDACITDIPYAETRSKWDVCFDLVKMWEILYGLCKQQGAFVLFCSQPYSSKLRLSNVNNYRYDWKWIKNRATGFANANYRPMRRYQDILVFSRSNASVGGKKNSMPYFPQGIKELNKVMVNTPNRKGKVLQDGNNCGKQNQLVSGGEYIKKYTNYPDNLLFFDCEKKYLHPTQKPVALMEYLIKTYTRQGQMVLDFTSGSGTTGVACMNTGRRCILIEKEEKYCDITIQRLKDKEKEIAERLF